MDQLFEYPIDSPELREALIQRLEEAYQIVGVNARPLSRSEFESEFDSWNAELQPLGEPMISLLDEVADEVELDIGSQIPTCFGGTVALRMMEWARERLELPDPDTDEETDPERIGMNLNVFVCGWQFVKALESHQKQYPTT